MDEEKVQREPEINSVLRQLREMREIQHDQIMELYERLQPLMCQAPSVSDEGEKRAEKSCSHAEELAKINFSMVRDTGVLDNILNRLEI